MPSSVTATVSTSAFATRFPRKMAENTTMNTGDVNCSTMALAAVVSLLAATNSVNVPQSATALRALRALSLYGMRLISM